MSILNSVESPQFQLFVSQQLSLRTLSVAIRDGLGMLSVAGAHSKFQSCLLGAAGPGREGGCRGDYDVNAFCLPMILYVILAWAHSLARSLSLSDLVPGDSPGSRTCLNGKFLVNKSASQVHRGYQIASYVLYEVSQTGIFTGMSTFNLRSVFQRSFQRTIPCHKGPHLSPMGALMI